MTTLTTLSYIHVGNHHKKVPSSVSNEERLRMLRAVWPVQMGNNVFNYGANARVDGLTEMNVIASDRGDLRRESAHRVVARNDGEGDSACMRSKPEIDTGRSTLTPRSPASTLPKSPTGGIPGFLFKLASVFGVVA